MKIATNTHHVGEH